MYPEAYGAELRVLSLRLRGFSLYGGGLAAGWHCVAVRRLPVRALACCGRAGAARGVAFCLARIGCFLNGCCGGVATQSALGRLSPRAGGGVIFGQAPGVHRLSAAVKVWPTQLFEFTAALPGLAAIPLARKWKLAPGSTALLYLMWFTAARWAILPLRALPYEDM